MVEGAVPSGGVAIRRIETNDIERVTDMLARAFDDDPVMNFIAKPDARRSERIRQMMLLGLERMTLPFGECYVADDAAGAALWNPPGERLSGLLNELRLLPPLMRIVGLTRMRRVIGTLNILERKHPEEPHFYLMVLGVEPEQQGRGIGSQLLAGVLERCDAEGVPAYLENSKERNLPLYERHGFEVTERVDLPNGGPPVWLMWRDPA